MPLRTAAIRRCGFKLQKNDKYQCQKAGDKFQPIVKLWYCTRHDSHAQDRCQVLVEWAGKGAQCGQLGVFDKRSGKKLCGGHLSQASGDDRSETETEQCHTFSRGSIDHQNAWQDAAKLDGTAPDQPTPLSPSHPDRPADPHRHVSLTSVELQCPSNSVEAVVGMGMSEQERSAEEHFSNARVSLSDSDFRTFQDGEKCRTSATLNSTPSPASENDKLDENGTLLAPQGLNMDCQLSEPAAANTDLDSRSEAGLCGDLNAPTAEGDHASILHPFSDVSQNAKHSHCTIASPVKTTQETRSERSVEMPRNLGQAAHVRIDSLSPLTPTFMAGGPEVDTPNTLTSNVALGPSKSTRSSQTAHGATIATRSIQARNTSLNALQDQEASVSNRIAAVYAQCCVCLEKHGEHNMREIATCKHRYRELCLKKAIKAENLRRFNCSSCKTWMAARKENMTDSGKL